MNLDPTSHGNQLIDADYELKSGSSIYAPDYGDDGALTVTADNIVIDGKGGTLKGLGAKFGKNQASGKGIYIKGKKNVTIKNLKIKGYRWGIFVEDSENIIIENVDVSDNYDDTETIAGHARVDRSRWMDIRADHNYKGGGMAFLNVDTGSI